jgi:hypothetical protein
MLVKMYFAESVVNLLDIIKGNNVSVEKRNSCSYAVDGDHRLYSSVELRASGQHHLRDGVPVESMAYLELTPYSSSFQRLQRIINEAIADNQLTPVKEAIAV